MIKILLSAPRQILTMVTDYRNSHVLWTGVFSDRASQVALVVKNSPASAGDVRDAGSIPGWGRHPEGGHGNPLQYSCLENPLTEEPGKLQSVGLQRVGPDWSNWAWWQESKVLPKGSGLYRSFLVPPMLPWLLLFLFAWEQGDHR